MEETPTIILLGVPVKLFIKDLEQAGSYGLCFPTKAEIHLAKSLKAENVLSILCHEIAHFLYSKTRNPEGDNMSGEDFSTLSEHWAGIIPQLNMLHFEFGSDGTLEFVAELVEVAELDN
jgi:hypothetical protein